MSPREVEILSKVAEILKKYFKPEKIILFGSKAKSDFAKNSDFDLAIDKERPNIRTRRKLKEEIEEISGLYKVDVVYLNSVASSFKEIIMKTGRIIYERKS
ncbi:MAG: nucleotidyltransferase domain-containing protein [bacterium]